MGRRTRPLTAAEYRELPPGLAGSGAWFGHEIHRDPAAMFNVKHRWIRSVDSAWGTCGQLACCDGEPAGLVLYAPPALMPRAEHHPSGPPSPDALLLVEILVLPQARGQGVGRLLTQAMAADLVRRRVAPAIEAYATTDEAGATSATDGRPPREFLEAVGFLTWQEHPDTPRLRMDLRGTRTWVHSVERAWGRLGGWVRPAVRPAHGHRTAHRAGITNSAR